MNDLDNAANECPNYPLIRLDRLHLSQAAVLEIDAGRSTLEEFPNDALLHLQAARLAADNGDLELAKSLANRSSKLDPLNASIIGQAEQLLGQPSTQ